MTPAELKAHRRGLNLTQKQFGEAMEPLREYNTASETNGKGAEIMKIEVSTNNEVLSEIFDEKFHEYREEMAVELREIFTADLEDSGYRVVGRDSNSAYYSASDIQEAQSLYFSCVEEVESLQTQRLVEAAKSRLTGWSTNDAILATSVALRAVAVSDHDGNGFVDFINAIKYVDMSSKLDLLGIYEMPEAEFLNVIHRIMEVEEV